MSEETHDHTCRGPIVFDGPCEVHVVQKSNNGGIKLYANGAIRKCDECGWPFANSDECKFASANEEK